jgi:hypothetical protein
VRFRLCQPCPHRTARAVEQILHGKVG